MKAETLRKLAELNLAPEQMAGVLDILADLQEAEEKRKEDQRERVRKHRMKQTCNVTETLHEDYIPSPDKEKSPTPPKEINPNPSLRSETKRGTRLPVDWALPSTWGKWAIGEGHDERTIRLEAQKFRDFWCSKSGKDAAKLDWEATWRNWMRNAPRSRNLGTPLPKPKSEFMQHQDDVQRELDKVLGRKRNDEFTGDTIDLESANWRSH